MKIEPAVQVILEVIQYNPALKSVRSLITVFSKQFKGSAHFI